ncbi:hypothetical protein FA95DRAFT_1679097 [Auriscalpium vulgare]|uniref:Uncharacterized protein n=1 Tax=Auriscalpium vulgare TaxID=40419 RepID=A0ACB8RTB9_9AGAM|nr:hypothetical protein FA95DRAFT_1679097 [Auriscalpium vulgare]
MSSSAQTIARPAYEFLSHPPPPKSRPTQPLPSTPRSPAPKSPVYEVPPPPVLLPAPRSRRSRSTVIANWAADIQPGSPAPVSPPCPSPYNVRRRPSLTRRRASVTTPRAPSVSFLTLLDTPSAATPSLKDWTPDLGALGYAYAVVPVSLPPTPVSAPLPEKPKAKKVKGRAPPPIIVPLPGHRSPARTPSPKKKHTRFIRLLRPRSPTHTHTRLASPTSASAAAHPYRRPKEPSSAPPPSSPDRRAATIAARKKQKYARTGAAPSVDNELALMQLLDGGSAEHNLRRLPAHGAGVFRDADGSVWVDQDEPFEFAPLLLADVVADAWEQFDGSNTSASPVSEDLMLAVPVAEAPAINTAEAPALVSRAVLSVPARGGARRSATFVRLPGSFTPPRSPTRPHVQGDKRRPAPLTLRPQPTPIQRPSNSPLGFTDAFSPAAQPQVNERVMERVVKKAPSRMNIRGLLKAMGGK